MVDEVPELLAVARRAPRIGVEDDVSGRGVELKLGGPAVTVVGEGPAVDLEDEGIPPRRVEAGRLEEPTLDLAAIVGGFRPDLLRRRELHAAEDVVVERCQNARLEAGPADRHLRGPL